MLHRPDGKAVEAIVVVGWIDPSTIEVQIVAVRLRVERRAPVVAVRAVIVETRPVAVARSWEEGTLKPLSKYLNKWSVPAHTPVGLQGRCGSERGGCLLIRAHGGILRRKPPCVFSFSRTLRMYDGQPMNLSFSPRRDCLYIIPTSPCRSFRTSP